MKKSLKKLLQHQIKIKIRKLNQCLLILIVLLLTACQNKENVNKVVPLSSPAGSHSAQPNLFAGKDKLYLSWQNSADSISSLLYSEYSNEKWSSPVKLDSGTNWFINWADYPTLAVNKKGSLLSNYLPKSGDATYAYDIHLVLNSPDTTFKLHDDTTQTEHGFVSAVPLENDDFLVVWLDGRNTGGSGHEHGGAMSLRAARIDPTGKKTEEWLLDNRVCDCCQTHVVSTADGPLVAYRDRSEEEIRDIYFTRFRNNQWTKPQPVADDQWKIQGCPVNGPRVAADEDIIAVAYFSAKENNPKVMLAVSGNSGENFDAPVTVSQGNSIGRVDIDITDDEVIWISWMEHEKKKAVLYAASYNQNGERLTKVKVADLPSARSSGFPQMEFFKESLYFAWTEANKPSTIQLKQLNIN